MPETRYTIVVVDLDGTTEQTLRLALAGDAATVVAQRTIAEALQALDDRAADLLIADFHSTQAPVQAWLPDLQRRWPGMPVLLLADQVAADDVAQAVSLGVSDLLMRPVVASQLMLAVQKALIATRRSAAAPPPPPPGAEGGIVFGRSPSMQALHAQLLQLAPSSSTVLIRGESGTGKELFARALHRLSTRAARPFIKIDCTSLPENLIESELFGFEKGAFTGASGQKLGRVQLADGGTLFLDEIGELTAPTQAKLLRLLQDREFERLGGHKTIHVDVRVVAATHRDLEGMVEQGLFRQDLFYRLNVLPLWIAPLRARRADIPELARHFCAEVAGANGKPELGLSAEALDALTSQRWPGNVRQLQNFVERLVVLGKGPAISAANVAAELARPVRFATETGPAGADAAAAAEDEHKVVPLEESLRVAERQALLRALDRVHGNRSAAARLLGVSRSTLYTKLGDYGLL